jgi:hypothetical protein
MEQHARVAAPPACGRTDEWRLAALCSTDTIAKSGSCFEKEPHRLRGNYRQSHSLQQIAHMDDRLKAVATFSLPHPRGMLLPLPLPKGEDEGEGFLLRGSAHSRDGITSFDSSPSPSPRSRRKGNRFSALRCRKRALNTHKGEVVSLVPGGEG